MAAKNPASKSYSAVVQGTGDAADDQASRSGAQTQGSASKDRVIAATPRKRSPSPSHIPKTAASEDSVYVLTIMTDPAHHARMTALRNRYFPKDLNKLAAHLTLFHALPGSALESKIVPHLRSVTSETLPFEVCAARVFRMKRGIAISIHPQTGGHAGQQIHSKLQSQWKQDGFLSDQDAGGCKLHYTIMNKVDDESTVSQSFNEVSRTWKGDSGSAEGLALYKYDRGYWKLHCKFPFANS